MQCLKPTLLKMGFRPQLHVSCGQCVPCLITRQEGWVGRCLLEQTEHNNVAFVTLTYKEDPGILTYTDFQLFMKRLRKATPDIKFRFVACGEYGEKHGRGHWHAIIYGLKVFYMNFPETIWPHGFSQIGPITSGAIRYVAGYCLKRDKNLPKIWRTSSNPGIGLNLIRIMARRSAALSLSLSHYSLRWPSYYMVGKSRFPITAGAKYAYREAYREAGGLIPHFDTENEITLDYLQERRHGDKLHAIHEKRSNPYHGQTKARKTTL